MTPADLQLAPLDSFGLECGILQRIARYGEDTRQVNAVCDFVAKGCTYTEFIDRISVSEHVLCVSRAFNREFWWAYTLNDYGFMAKGLGFILFPWTYGSRAELVTALTGYSRSMVMNVE